MKYSSNLRYGIAAITLPLLVALVATRTAFSTAETSLAAPLAHAGVIAGVIMGVFFLTRVEFQSRKHRGAAFAAYVPLIVAASLLVSFYTACGFGYCL